MLLFSILDQKKKSCEINEKLWQWIQEVIRDSIEHSKQITTQMSSYDIHDERHSEAVLQIIENLLGDKLNQLSFYELVLLYLSAYLHDSGMALPKWEYDALRAVEGNENFYDTSLRFAIRNDFKPVQKIEEIRQNLNTSYNFDFNRAKDYIFIEKNEDEVIEKLIEVITDYEIFRNKYSSQLKYFSNAPDYLNFSEIIRSEFIRLNHHKKASQNIHNLQYKLEGRIGSFNANLFCNDLANICQAHGESIDYVKTLPLDTKDWENNQNNIQFIAEILRLADIIHFSSDRAPLSLYSEKQITDKESLKHWNVKFQDVKYEIKTEGNECLISYAAYCNSPEMFYFLNNYIDYIDSEINNFYVLKREWDRMLNYIQYEFFIHPVVLRDNIKYDDRVFIPDTDLNFKLDQERILDLLMGVQLYKDRFACLREIYQNALDTSRCLLAYNNKNRIAEKICIEFGIGEEEVEGIKRKYIYCLDHGLGMDKNIIKNYLLHIGNSYYKSKEFDAKNTEWNFDVKPTSQFGIGILSCFMISDKIGITTVFYENREKLSLIISGISEKCYYLTPKKSDIEKIGTHGTIVKLFLKDQYSTHINAEYITKMPLLLMENDDNDISLIENLDKVKNNLFYILFRYIGVSNEEIPTFIYTNTNEVHSIYNYNTVFDHRSFNGISEEDIKKLYSSFRFFDGNNPYKDYLDNIDKIKNYVIETKTENVTLYTLLPLPKKGINYTDVRLLFYGKFLGNKQGSLCIDGISVSNSTDRINDFLNLQDNLTLFSIVNFDGEKKPTLSIDRTSCVCLPELSQSEINELNSKLLSSIENQLREHIISENIVSGSNEFYIIYDYICSCFPKIAFTILVSLLDTFDDGIIIPDLEQLRIADILKKDEIEISNINFTNIREISRQLILSKCISPNTIEVKDQNLKISSSSIKSIPLNRHYFGQKEISISSCVICSDRWTGKFEEYDMVSSLWPIINPKLFEKINNSFENIEITEHCKLIDSVGNGIQALMSLDPTLINPTFGLGTREIKAFEKKNINIGQPDRIERNYWLFELSNHGEMEREEQKSPTLFIYINPRTLTEDEEKSLKTFEDTDPIFVQGIREGWSIYLFGNMKEYIIKPGIVKREVIENSIPETIKIKKNNLTYINTQGKIIL